VAAQCCLGWQKGLQPLRLRLRHPRGLPYDFPPTACFQSLIFPTIYQTVMTTLNTTSQAQPSPAQPSPAQPSPAQPSSAQPSPAQSGLAQSSHAQSSFAQSSVAQSSSPQTGLQPVDLWQKALTTLDDDLRASLDFKSSTKRDILEKTLKTAEEKRQLSLRKRWRFKRNGKEVVVRDVLEKIIKWLDYFKAIGDVAAQYDPAHAALPWAGVRFLLNVSASGRLNTRSIQIWKGRCQAIQMFLAPRYRVSKLCLTSSRAMQFLSMCICSVIRLQATSSNVS
jgi:hypothetical protein